MRLSLSVLDHLGRNLYSNIPAVLSEVAANTSQTSGASQASAASSRSS